MNRKLVIVCFLFTSFCGDSSFADTPPWLSLTDDLWMEILKFCPTDSNSVCKNWQRLIPLSKIENQDDLVEGLIQCNLLLDSSQDIQIQIRVLENIDRFLEKFNSITQAHGNAYEELIKTLNVTLRKIIEFHMNSQQEENKVLLLKALSKNLVVDSVTLVEIVKALRTVHSGPQRLSVIEAILHFQECFITEEAEGELLDVIEAQWEGTLTSQKKARKLFKRYLDKK